MVDIPDGRGVRSVRARVEPGCWVDIQPDGSGDVALLRLAESVPGSGTSLRRMALQHGQSVSVLGFPRGAVAGMRADATVAGESWPAGVWVQLNARPGHPGISRGFSGAGVVDVETGWVIGMVVTEYIDVPDRGVRVAWMMPVEEIEYHLRAVGPWAKGPPAVDRRISRTEPRDSDPVVAGKVTGFLGDRTAGGVMVMVTGGRRSTGSASLRAAVVSSDREHRRTGSRIAPRGSGVDLAIDASHRTADEVARRIADRMGLRTDRGPELVPQVVAAAPAMSLVVDRIDAAAEPGALVRRLLGPLARKAVERDIRLLLGFGRPRDSIEHRLDLLAERIRELAEVEGRIEELRRRMVLPGRAPGPRAARLRVGLTQLRDGNDDPDGVLPGIAVLEEQVDRSLRELEPVRRQLGQRLAARDRLRHLLEAHKARATDCGLYEDPELGELYRNAYEALWRGPTDLERAGRLVDDYLREVRTRCERSGRGWP